MRRILFILLFLLLTACGTQMAVSGGGYGHETTADETTTTYHKPPHETYPHESTTTKPHESTTTYPPHQTTTTYPHHTTTTMKQHNSTTTSISSTTTSVNGTTTTTTIKVTTTTSGGVTTTTRETTTTVNGSTTTTRETSTTPSPTTAPPSAGLFGVNVSSVCVDGAPAISITFGNRPLFNGDQGELAIIALPSGITVSNQLLTFQSNQTVTIPYPTVPPGTTSVRLEYGLNGESATATIGPPLTNCTTTTTGGTSSSTTTTTSSVLTTSTTAPPSNSTTTSTPSTSTSSTVVGSTSSSPLTSTTTTILGETVFLRGAASVCQTGVPMIQIDFGNEAQFAGRTGTLTMSDVNGNVLSVQPLVYAPNTSVFLLYPGSAVDPVTGEVTDVPGWNLNADGFWVPDPSDVILRQGINLTYAVNPTATAFVTYPPESSGCATPTGPFPPGETGAATTVAGALPVTGSGWVATVSYGVLFFGAGWFLIRATRRKV